MSITTIVVVVAGFVLLFFWVSVMWVIHNRITELKKLTDSQGKRISALETHMLRFQQPEAIADDMEATADLIEARMAGRQAMPRPGSLPHARIAKRRDPRGKTGWDKSKS